MMHVGGPYHSESNSLYTESRDKYTRNNEFFWFNLRANIDVKINNASTKIRILADRITEDDAKSITLAVLKDTSKEFEQVQKRTDFIKNSSFAEEDLPSNILNFYFEVENFSEQKIERLCNCLSVEQSCWIADRYNFSRNQTFDPIIIFPGGVKPIEFNSITEAKAGVLWEKI